MSGVLDDDQPASSTAPAGDAPAPAERRSTDTPASPMPVVTDRPLAPPPPHRPRLRRTWPQRLVIGFNVVVAMACVGTVVGLRYGYDTVGRLDRVFINVGPTVVSQEELSTTKDGRAIPGFNEALPTDLAAENMLVVAIDKRGCQSDNPQYAGAFGEGGGANTDTMMVLRTDPTTQQAAILSLPRDLWVRVPGTQSRDRINALFDPLNPNLLIQAIDENLGIPIDHYVAMDFCGFRDLVNAVGPIRIPFAMPARDENTGLQIDAPGCVAFEGDAALAYVRSRYYQYQDEDGDWRFDDTGEYGRQVRQQDFVRRVLRKAIDSGARDPGKLQQLVRIGLENVTVDQNLTAQDVYDLARAFRDIDPTTLRSFSIVGNNAMKGDRFVITFSLEEPTNAAIVAVFSGQARLADLPVETDEVAEVAAAPGDALSVPAAPAEPTPDGELPEVSLDPTSIRTADAVVPPDDPTCT